MTGTMYVGGKALGDVMSGRVSSMQDYVRTAFAGSVVGMINGASVLGTHGLGLPDRMAIGAASGMLESAVSQQITNGEIDLGQVIIDGTISSVSVWALAGLLKNLYGRSLWMIICCGIR